MTASLTVGALSLEHQCVLSSRRQQCKLIESQNFTARLYDSLASFLGDTESNDAQFWNREKAQVIGNCTDNDSKILFLSRALLQQTNDSLQRDDWAMDFAHKQTLEDDLVELLVRSAVQVTIQLKEEGIILFSVLVRSLI